MNLPQEFVGEAVEIFHRMLGVQLAERPASAGNSLEEDFEVSAIVAITGPCPGRLVLGFSERGACEMVSKMCGQPHSEVDAEVMDGVEELANIIAGNGCRHLEEKGFREVATSVPHIMIGQRRRAARPEDKPWTVSRWFESDLGTIRVEVELNAACAA
jgi:CheY-specific phosphatase CheX